MPTITLPWHVTAGNGAYCRKKLVLHAMVQGGC